MDTCMDLLTWLEPDMFAKIIGCLDDPADLVRVGAVSQSWRCFVLDNDFSKQLCLRMFPQLLRVSGVVEVNQTETEDGMDVGSSSRNNQMEWENKAREHRTYASLARCAATNSPENCISEAISASSTDNDPIESIANTLDAREVVAQRNSYWSSTGQRDVKVPETLVYKLVSNLCVISEFRIRPYQAYFRPGNPIYSASAVRFRMGHLKSPESHDESCGDTFVWTYTSQEFPMEQLNRLQKFKLSEPVLFIGGYLQIELLGRVQRQEDDGLFYMCVSHVQAVGRSMAPRLDAQVIDPSGKVILVSDLKAENQRETIPKNSSFSSTAGNLERRVRTLEQIVELLRWNEFYGWRAAEEESDEELFIL